MAKRVGKAGGRKETETKAIEPKHKGRRTTALVPRERWTPAASPPSPFASMRRFAEEMDRLFGDFRFGTSSLLPRFELPWESREAGEGAWLPSLNASAHRLSPGPSTTTPCSSPPTARSTHPHDFEHFGTLNATRTAL